MNQRGLIRVYLDLVEFDRRKVDESLRQCDRMAAAAKNLAAVYAGPRGLTALNAGYEKSLLLAAKAQEQDSKALQSLASAVANCRLEYGALLEATGRFEKSRIEGVRGISDGMKGREESYSKYAEHFSKAEGPLEGQAQEMERLQRQTDIWTGQLAAAADVINTSVRSAVRGVSSEIAGGLVYGTHDWEGTMKGVLAQAAALSIEFGIMAALTAAIRANMAAATLGASEMMGKVSSAGGFLGGLLKFHSGGMVDALVRAHDGLMLRRDEVPVIAQRGEFIWSRQAVENWGAGFVEALHAAGRANQEQRAALAHALVLGPRASWAQDLVPSPRAAMARPVEREPGGNVAKMTKYLWPAGLPERNTMRSENPGRGTRGGAPAGGVQVTVNNNTMNFHGVLDRQQAERFADLASDRIRRNLNRAMDRGARLGKRK